jgi:hypothetical protein
VCVITVAPHTTQIFQVLDVTVFGVLRRRLGYKSPFEDEKETVKSIMKFYHDFKQTTVEPNIWGALQAIGFEFDFDTEPEPYRLLFNEEKLRQSARSASESYGRLASPWINCQVGGRGRMPDLAGSTNKKQE